MLRISVIMGVALLAVAACARPADQAQDPVREAYLLMDQKENARAIALLEPVVERDPSDREARILLASAYLGLAGVDVYAIHDHFKDLVFQQPLAERFSGGAAKRNPFGGLPRQQNLGNLPALAYAMDIETAMLTLRESMSFILRFPEVKKESFPLLLEAIRHLDAAGDEKDLRLYRVFARVVLVKSQFAVKVMSDPHFGEKTWLCKIDVDAVIRDLRWMAELVDQSIEDLSHALEKPSGFFSQTGRRLTDSIQVLSEVYEEKSSSAAGSEVLSRIRKELKCDSTP